ncbi:LpqB family beta-propeller domain-containing protein, partial [uncultured Aeromicrobium sp.]|uniref:LpqB family beta-propeller domain-containing protein n=1 Tax=uncultured Aeromicrobium sp. TaxID=337820 RepID=UPI0025DF8288
MGVLTALVLAACASIPASGPVTEVEDPQGLGESTARYTPAGPAPEATPEQIVRGFLEAMLAYPVTSQIAAEYLTPGAARDWRPGESTTVYSHVRVDPSVPEGSGRQLRVGWRAAAHLDEQGRYAPRDEWVEQQWRLERVQGQWRIAEVPDGTFITTEYFEDYFRPFDVYFLDRTGSHVVPDPVFRVVGDQLPTALLASVAEGPDGARAASVRSELPAPERLRASVPIDGRRVADVEFTIPMRELPPEERERLAAQIVWTLQGAPGVAAVRISGSDGVLAIGGRAVQDTAAFASYAPDASDGRIAAVIDERLRRLDPQTQRAVPGVSEVGEVAGVASDQSVVATVAPGRSTLTVRGDGEPTVVQSAGTFLDPVVDRYGVVWAVDDATVRTITGEQVRQLEAAPLGDLALTSFAISPDAARYAVTARGREGAEQLMIGAVMREAGAVERLGDPVVVPVDALAQMRSVTWVTGSRLALLAEGWAGEQAYSVRLDGSDLRPSLPGLSTFLPR